MPELPEVETVKRILETKITGHTITQVDILNHKSFSGDYRQIIGQKIISFTRLGKQLSIHLGNGLILLFHLKMTGQLIFVPPFSRGENPKGKGVSYLGHPTKNMFNQNLPSKSTRVILHLSSSRRRGSTLFFNDQRKFGWIKVLTQTELKQVQSTVGIDVLDSRFTSKYFYFQLETTKRSIKTVLLDQQLFAGIGNIYANDALFLAKINPSTPASSISKSRSLALYRSVLAIINESISHGGSTAKDNKYIHPDGSYGTHQYHFRVYQRSGESCSVCQNLITHLKLGGRGTFFCPHCQK